VPALLRDHGDATDFRVLQLGGGECAGASQQRIGTLFFEAAHERNYRDALKFQRKYPEALACAEAGLRSVAKALADAAGVADGEDLASLAASLAQTAPETASLAAELMQLGAAVALEEAPGEPAASSLFHRVDAWTVSAAAFCQRREPKLVLRDALPRSVASVP